ncbi:helix-turn-helix domain-containing protein [Flavobacterium branchiarum]|uniref:Helix-turn-helix domain-containing protein n=1 Tax=Flavobacterium branchiarum TaxID=1114870 RepID=A0ABV5FJE9_9FLAO|nr:helix-turn-helix domain-containing protein [Flavobacterium branchiarum]MDN3674287.1 helix-turn-helix domain-containing protein [Flavobacterium branchiarum]
MTYVNSFYFRGLNDADMEITVLDIQILKALHREIKEVSNLIAEMTTPYKALQQATKWLDQQEACQLLNISKRTLQTYRAKGILGATQINRKTYFRLSEVELLMQEDRPLKKQKK